MGNTVIPRSLPPTKKYLLRMRILAAKLILPGVVEIVLSELTGSENTVMKCHCLPTFSHVPSLYQDTVQWAVCLAHHL